jgi:glycerol kinase
MSEARDALFLCLDQGGHASRAALIDAVGNIRRLAYREIGTQRDGVRVEHDPHELYRSLHDAAEEVVASVDDGTAIAAAGLATQRSSIVCWDRTDYAPLSPVLSWQDRRAAEWLAKFADEEARVHEITGLVLSPHYGVSKLAWCLENLPPVADALAQQRLGFGPLATWLAKQLVIVGGEAPTMADPANASRTLLWDRRRRDWSDELLTLFGIPADCLPRSVPTRFEWGAIECAGRQLPLRVVTGDQSAALFAFGVPESDTVYANLGTGAFLQRSMSDPDADPGRLLASVVYQGNDDVISILEATVNGAGAAVNKFADDEGLDMDDVQRHSSDWLDQADNGSRLPLFINGVSGLGSPWWLSDMESRFEGEGSPEQKMAAVLESIAFLIAVNIESGNQVVGKDCRRVVVTGGLGSMDPLLQRIADLTGATVIRAEIAEATVLGLAYLVAGRPPDWPAVEAGHSFEPESNEALLGRYKQWRDLMPALQN